MEKKNTEGIYVIQIINQLMYLLLAISIKKENINFMSFLILIMFVLSYLLIISIIQNKHVMFNFFNLFHLLNSTLITLNLVMHKIKKFINYLKLYY